MGLRQLSMFSSEAHTDGNWSFWRRVARLEIGASALSVYLQSLFRAVHFLTCTHWQTLTRLVLNEGLTSALDYYTISSARVDIKYHHL
jgi:hypothetical protein